MNSYELVVILDPEQNVEEQEKLLTKITNLISETKGKISKIDNWGKKELAYPISKKRSGIFCVLEFTVPERITSSFKQKLQLEEKILRFLLIVTKGQNPPAPVKTDTGEVKEVKHVFKVA